MSDPISRRSLFKAAGAAGVAAALPGEGAARPAAPAAESSSAKLPQHTHAAASGLRFFFTEPEAAFVTAAVDRLIPPDEQWPGAAEAGVVDYIDRQLAGAYGAGARLYLQGPWKQGTPEQGYQLPLTPAQLYRVSIAAIGRHVDRQFGGRAFPQLSAAEQDRLLKDLETGAIQFQEIYPPIFFETLLANTIEGFFADPAYGGNRDMAGWRMIGFPGAYAQYATLVDKHGMTFDRPPIGMAGGIRGH